MLNEKVVAILAIMLLGLGALLFKQDGMILCAAIAAIAGLAGYSTITLPK